MKRNGTLLQERPPPVPPSRSYTVTGNTKLGYPQTRIMKMPFPGKEMVALINIDLIKLGNLSIVEFCVRKYLCIIDLKKYNFVLLSNFVLENIYILIADTDSKKYNAL